MFMSVGRWASDIGLPLLTTYYRYMGTVEVEVNHPGIDNEIVDSDQDSIVPAALSALA